MPQPATPTATAPSTSAESTPTVFLVAYTGGLEDPIFQSFTDQQAAQALFSGWSQDASGHDRVTLIAQEIQSDGTVLVLALEEFCPAWETSDD